MNDLTLFLKAEKAVPARVRKEHRRKQKWPNANELSTKDPPCIIIEMSNYAIRNPDPVPTVRSTKLTAWLNESWFNQGANDDG